MLNVVGESPQAQVMTTINADSSFSLATEDLRRL